MNILFIAPFSPPHTGNSLPIKVMYDHLVPNHKVDVVNLSKKTYKSGGFSLKKIFQTINIILKVWKEKRNRDVVYITVAESFGGNMRDICFYLINYRKLNKVIIHMLGGAQMKQIIDKNKGFQYKLNKFFISRLGGIVVEGQVQADFFAKVADRKNIHIIPNFAENYLFTSESAILDKFSNVEPVKILFLSNLLYGKGHSELLQAYQELDEDLKDKFSLDFAGGFESDAHKEDFLNRIKNEKRVKYHGHVNGDQKRDLYLNSHIFCLPTYYPYEGQPFCILEAYAAGNVVITTNHSGISQVFKDKKNGYEVQKKSIASLKSVLQRVLSEKSILPEIGISNLTEAKLKYSVSNYKSAMESVLDTVLSKSR